MVRLWMDVAPLDSGGAFGKTLGYLGNKYSSEVYKKSKHFRPTNRLTNQPTDKASYRDADASKKNYTSTNQWTDRQTRPLLLFDYTNQYPI